MAKHLTKRDVIKIVDMIDSWSEDKLRWKDICLAADRLVGRKPTRQSLASHLSIKEAYQSKVAHLRSRAGADPSPSNMKVAVERIRSLESKALRLEERNRALMQQFVVWQYNSYKYGLSEHQLNEPLPQIDRDRTDY